MAGHCDPPKEHQFSKDNQPENPGRKKGSRSLITILRELMDRKMKIKDPITGLPAEMSVSDVLMLRLLANGIKGDNRALQEIMDRLEGKALQKIANVGVEKIIVEYVDGDKNSSDKRVSPEQGSGGRSDGKDNSESGRGEVGKDVRDSATVDSQIAAGNKKDSDDQQKDGAES